MKKSTGFDLLKRMIAVALCALIFIGYMPSVAYAIEDEDIPTNSEGLSHEEKELQNEPLIPLPDMDQEESNSDDEITEDNIQEKATENQSITNDVSKKKGLLKSSEESDYQTGTFGAEGNNLTWTYSGGKLTITGQGEMEDFSQGVYAPWGTYQQYWHQTKEHPLATGYLPIKEIEIGSGVTKIGNSAFASNCSEVTKLSLPNSIVVIGHGAFWGDEQIKDFHWPTDLRYIGSHAFSACKSLTRVDLRDNVEVIYEEAFSDCENLRHFKIPQSIEKIYGNTFKNTSLKTLGFGDNYDIDIPWNERFPSGYETHISFEGASITKIVIPDGMTEVKGSIYFSRMPELTEVVIPSSVETISTRFDFCESLEVVDWSNSTNLRIIDSYFTSCPNLKRVILPDQANFEGSIFSGCKSLTEVHLPDSLEKIPEYCFEYCTSLKGDSFNWPSKLTAIGGSAFQGCTSLDAIELPETVETINESAFADCNNLSKFIFSNSDTEFDLDSGWDIFEGCSALKTAGPIGGRYKTNIEYGWTKRIPSKVFSGSKLETIYFPAELEALGESCFRNCDNLVKVLLPDNLKTIEEDAFSNCDDLEMVRLPSRIGTIRSSAFAYCVKLKRIMFRGDAPEMSGGIFEGDVITAYYPGTNQTWTSIILDKGDYYGEDVTWKPYELGDPTDPETEHTVNINHAGTAYVRFYLVDENGKTIPEARFKYIRHCGGHAEEMDNEHIITDFDGGYNFSTSYLTSSEEVRFDGFELLTDEPQKLKKGTEFTIKATVASRSYKEKWEIGLGKNLEFADDFSKAAFNNKDKAGIELIHNKDGTQDLKLSLTISDGFKDKINANMHSFGEALDPADALKIKASIAKKEVGNSTSYIRQYTHTIKNYSPNNTSHRKQVCDFIGVLVLLDYLGSNGTYVSKPGGVLMVKALERTMGSDLDGFLNLYFEDKSEKFEINASAGGAVVDFKNSVTGDFLGSVKIGDYKDSIAYSIGYSKDSSGATKKTSWESGVKRSSFSSAFSHPIAGLVGLKGFYGKTELNDISVTVDSLGAIKLKSCNYDSGLKDAIGWGDIYQYHSITASDSEAQDMIKNNPLSKSLTGNTPKLFNLQDYKDLQKRIAARKGRTKWSDTEKLTNEYKYEPKFELKPKDGGIGISLGIELICSHAWETEIKNGSILNGKQSIEVDSGAAKEVALNAANTWMLGDIFAAPFNILTSSLDEEVDSRTENSPKTISLKGATFKSDGTIPGNQRVTLMSTKKGTAKTSGAKKASVKSYGIATLTKSELKASSESESETFAMARTIGDAYQLIYTDEKNAELEKLGGGSPQLTITYSNEDLTAAEIDNSEESIAMYKLDDVNSCYEYIGGTVNISTMSVTAEISEPGQYVLATNTNGLQIRDIDCTDGLSAKIDSLSGVKKGQVFLDGEELITERKFASNYNKKTHQLKYSSMYPNRGEHELRFVIVDGSGRQQEFVHIFSKINTPVIESVEVGEGWYDTGIPIKAHITTDGTEADEIDVRTKVEMYTSGGERAEDIFTMEKEGDCWIANYIPRRGYRSFHFTVQVTDRGGSTSFSCDRVHLDNRVTYTKEGVEYQFARNTGVILSIDATDAEKTTLSIPDKINGIEVKRIAAEAFDYGSPISVIIPEGIELIGENAFEDIESLRSITLPESLKIVEAQAFLNCNNLKNIRIPSGVNKIGNNAFGYYSRWGEMTVCEDFTISAEEGTEGSRYAKQLIKDQRIENGTWIEPEDMPIKAEFTGNNELLGIVGDYGMLRESLYREGNSFKVTFEDNHVEEYVYVKYKEEDYYGARIVEGFYQDGDVETGEELYLYEDDEDDIEIKEGINHVNLSVYAREGEVLTKLIVRGVEESNSEVRKLQAERYLSDVEIVEKNILHTKDRIAETAADLSEETEKPNPDYNMVRDAEYIASDAEWETEHSTRVARQALRSAESVYGKNSEEYKRAESMLANIEEMVLSVKLSTSILSNTIADIYGKKAKKALSETNSFSVASANEACNAAYTYSNKAETAKGVSNKALQYALEMGLGEDDELVKLLKKEVEKAESYITDSKNTKEAAHDVLGKAKKAEATRRAEKQRNDDLKEWNGTWSSKIPAVKSAKFKAAKKKVTASWKKATKKNLKKFDKVEVQVCPNKSFLKANSKRVEVKKTKKSATVKGLKKGTYYVRVRNVKGSGTGKLVSKWSKVKKVKVK